MKKTAPLPLVGMMLTLIGGVATPTYAQESTVTTAPFTLAGPETQDNDVGHGSPFTLAFRNAFLGLGGRVTFGKALGDVKLSSLPNIYVQEFEGPDDRSKNRRSLNSPRALLVYNEVAGKPRVIGVVGDIARIYLGRGGLSSDLGEPLADGAEVVSFRAGRAIVQNFRFGVIISSAAGTFPVSGALYQRYRRDGEWGRFWGFPIADPDATQQTQAFEEGTMGLNGMITIPSTNAPASNRTTVYGTSSPYGYSDYGFNGYHHDHHRPPTPTPTPAPRLPSTLTSHLGSNLLPPILEQGRVQKLIHIAQEAQKTQQQAQRSNTPAVTRTSPPPRQETKAPTQPEKQKAKEASKKH